MKRLSGLLVLLIAYPGIGGGLVAQDAPVKNPQPSDLDKELLRDLKLPPGASSRSAPEGEDLGQENPIVWLQVHMNRVAQRLQMGDTSAATQRLQQEILDRIREWLEQHRQALPSESLSENVAGKSVEEPSGTVESAATRPEPVGATGAASESALRTPLPASIWGHLPERVRHQLESRTSELFLPKYQELIEAYYRRLVEWNDWQVDAKPERKTQ